MIGTILILLGSIAGLVWFVYMELNGKLKKFSPEMERRLKQLEDARVIPI